MDGCNTYLSELAARFVLHEVRDEELPGCAIRALELGCDGHCLRMLAGWTEARIVDCQDLFRRVLEEQNVELPTLEEAIRRRLRPIIQAFVDRRLDISLLAEVLDEQLGMTGATGCGSP